MTGPSKTAAVDTPFDDIAQGKHRATFLVIGLSVLALVAGIVALTDVARHEVQPEGL